MSPVIRLVSLSVCLAIRQQYVLWIVLLLVKVYYHDVFGDYCFIFSQKIAR